MKNFFSVSAAIFAMAFLTSCGINTATFTNHNANQTQVQLSNNNFKVLDKINGSAEVSYVLIFGGMNKK